MKKKYDIYQIDNILIKIGYIFFAVFFFTAYPLISKISSGFAPLYEKLTVLMFFGAGSAAMLWTGYHYRIMENRINSILKILAITSEVSLTELHKNTGYSLKSIENAIVTINKKLPYYYVINKSADTISDGRLTTKLARVESCSSCGKRINLDFSISSDVVPECPYCGIPLQPDRWNTLKREAILNIQNKNSSESAGGKILMIPHDFSWPLFILLLIVFWPVGLIYLSLKYIKF